MPYKDPERQREYWREWYRKNPDRVKRKVGSRRAELLEWYLELKKRSSCARCSESHPHCVEFHHQGEKFKLIKDMVKEGYSRKRILKELDVCIPLCVNCHRKQHPGSSLADDPVSELPETVKRRRHKAAMRGLVQSVRTAARCVECGESDNECLDFHHIENKLQEISTLANQGRGRAVILKEIQKCIVLCANCHRKLHAG